MYLYILITNMFYFYVLVYVTWLYFYISSKLEDIKWHIFRLAIRCVPYSFPMTSIRNINGKDKSKMCFLFNTYRKKCGCVSKCIQQLLL